MIDAETQANYDGFQATIDRLRADLDAANEELDARSAGLAHLAAELSTRTAERDAANRALDTAREVILKTYAVIPSPFGPGINQHYGAHEAWMEFVKLAVSLRVAAGVAATPAGDPPRQKNHLHVCLSCAPDSFTPGPGCINCRSNTGYDQTPCVNCPGVSTPGDPR